MELTISSYSLWLANDLKQFCFLESVGYLTDLFYASMPLNHMSLMKISKYRKYYELYLLYNDFNHCHTLMWLIGQVNMIE